MDRLSRHLTGCGVALTLILPTVGCKSTSQEVPPSPAFSSNVQNPPAVGFNSAPNPVNTSAGMPQTGAGGYGIPTPASSPSYTPAGTGGGGFGGVGTNMGAPAIATPDSVGMTSPGGVSNPATSLPQSGTGANGPAAGVGLAPESAPASAPASPTQNPF